MHSKNTDKIQQKVSIRLSCFRFEYEPKTSIKTRKDPKSKTILQKAAYL